MSERPWSAGASTSVRQTGEGGTHSEEGDENKHDGGVQKGGLIHYVLELVMGMQRDRNEMLGTKGMAVRAQEKAILF